MIDLEFSLIGMYLVTFFAYLFSVELGKSYVRAANKIILASLYLIISIIAFCLFKSVDSIDTIILIALLFTWIGDIVLLVRFKIGAGFFTIGNILIFIYQLLKLNQLSISFDKYWFFIPIYLTILISFGIYYKKSKKLDFKKMYWLTIGYLAFVSLQGCLGITIYAVVDNNMLICLGAGAFLFMLSDYVLVIYNFMKKKDISIQRLNTALYFVGILLISISFVM